MIQKISSFFNRTLNILGELLYFIVFWILNQQSEAAVQRCFWENMFWKYAANLQEKTNAEVQFQENCKATLWKWHFGMGVLLQIFCFFQNTFPKNTSGRLLLNNIWLLLKRLCSRLLTEEWTCWTHFLLQFERWLPSFKRKIWWQKLKMQQN